MGHHDGQGRATRADIQGHGPFGDEAVGPGTGTVVHQPRHRGPQPRSDAQSGCIRPREQQRPAGERFTDVLDGPRREQLLEAHHVGLGLAAP